MKRVFEIEYPDYCRLDTQDLLVCLMDNYSNAKFNVEDVTDKMRSLESRKMRSLESRAPTRYLNADFSNSPVSAGCQLEE